MNKRKLLECCNVMHDRFLEVARTSDRQSDIEAFLLAYDVAYGELIGWYGVEQIPISPYRCGIGPAEA